MRRLVAALALFAAGCTFEWNGEQPGFGLSGSPPPLSSFDKLNAMPAQKASLMLGPDGASWAAFCEFRSGSSDGGVVVGGRNSCKRMHLVALGSGTGDETIEADAFTVSKHELFVMHDDATAMTRTVTMHRPGDPESADVSFVMPAGPAILVTNDNGNDDVFTYLVRTSTTPTFTVFRRDQKYQLTIPIPPGVNPAGVTEQTAFDFLLSGDGNWLVERTPDWELTSWSTLDGSSHPLGQWDPEFAIDDAHHAVLVTYSTTGFHSIQLDDSYERQLGPDVFDMSTLVLDGNDAFYQVGGTIYRTPLDGSAPPTAVVEHAARLWLRGPNGELVYSKNPPLQYAAGAGDAWIGPWSFMQRGHVVRFSGDGARLFFLEHAATAGGYGDLTAVANPNGAPDTLAINVHRYDELPDGRLVAIENAVYAGNWNRLVLIDEAARQKTWLVPSAVDYVMTPDATELVVDVVSGASGYDILRVPAP